MPIQTSAKVCVINDCAQVVLRVKAQVHTKKMDRETTQRLSTPHHAIPVLTYTVEPTDTSRCTRAVLTCVHATRHTFVWGRSAFQPVVSVQTTT